MRKFLVFVITIILYFATCSISFATDFSKITDNAKIETALNLLEKTNSTATINMVMGQNNAKKPTKIMFFALGTISPSYANAHAMATSDDYGNPYILINEKHKNAPAEAIACLITHEITHQLKTTSMDEEIQAWTNEAVQWTKFKELNPSVSYSGELVDRLNRISDLYKKGNNSNFYIVYEVKRNLNYVSLK